ncbi:lytic transglycosylase domain-containing protein [Burkholderia sp. 9775_39]|uniref:lytic transglycosylase domain-containing protein n=1 Tax=unclassified Burkholderia TaxID=2613784 RepID=UPI0018C3788E|nr:MULTISPECIES: lytic transglycosylase domain-containing protein [unclassified Burkholderia]MBG0879431.1 lytic transglycosylase domain-containing protein [Burkholderia sp. 9775_39]MBG0884572.1 lytic transglycosylase domain-containing protein [Burkholderia sp. 9773_38]
MAEEFVIRIQADDAATATIKKIQAALGKVTAPVDKAQKRFANIGAVGMRSFEKLTKGLESAARAAHTLVDKVVELVPGLAALGAAGTVAGIAGLTNRFGNFGFALNKSSKLLGMNAQDLAAWHVAAKRAGVSAEEFDSAISSSQMVIRDAANGANPAALVLMQKMGVQIQRNKDGSVDYYTTQMRLMRAIAGQRSPVAQRAAADAVGYGGLLPMLQQGTYGEDKARAFRKGLISTPDELARATKFKEEVNDLEDSVSGLGNSIGASLIPVLEPVVTQFSAWLDAHRAEIADKLAEAVQRFVNWISKVDWDGVAKDAKDLWDALGGAKGVMVAIAAITFAGPVAGIVSLIENLTKLATTVAPAAVKALSPLGGVPAVAGTAAAGFGGWEIGKWLRPYYDEYVRKVTGGDRWSLNDYLTGTHRLQLGATGGYTQEELDSLKDGGGAKLTKNAPRAATAESNSLFSSLESQYGLPHGLLDSVWAVESGRGANMLSPAGAMGHFQFMPATAKQYGLSDPGDLQQSATAAARMYSDLLKANGGDLDRALAAYNWGQGNLNRGGLGAAPSETRKYIAAVEASMAGAGPLTDVAARSGSSGVAGATTAQQSMHVTLDMKNVPQGMRAEAKTADGNYLPTRVEYRLDGI